MRQIASEIPELDRKGLREFGFTMGGIVAVLFGLALPWLLNARFPVWPWWLAGALAGWAVLAPHTLRTVYRLWMRFGLLLNRVTTPIILGIVFFLLITPIALVMRLAGRDVMARKFDPTAKTYRVASRRPTRDKMEKPY